MPGPIAPVFDSPVASAIAWGAAGSSYLEANSQIVEYLCLWAFPSFRPFLEQ